MSMKNRKIKRDTSAGNMKCKDRWHARKVCASMHINCTYTAPQKTHLHSAIYSRRDMHNSQNAIQNKKLING